MIFLDYRIGTNDRNSWGSWKQEEKSVGGEKENLLLAVGLSDNSIVIWDLKRCEPRFCFVCSGES